MMDTKLSLALKITNWCNMNCAHCCERSGMNAPMHFMPIETVEKYTAQFRDLDMRKYEHLVFTGGEVMAPYFHRQNFYVPQCLDVAYRGGFAPFIKTNGLWGGNGELRGRVLNDLAKMAHRHQRLVSLDISVDEFHNNVPHVAAIIEHVIKNSRLTPAIRISLVGLNTKNSRMRFAQLIGQLSARGISMRIIDDMTMAVEWNGVVVCIYYGFDVLVARMGRAVDNNLGRADVDGMPDASGASCLQIDNTDTAILNYKWRTPVQNRPMDMVVADLISRMNKAR